MYKVLNKITRSTTDCENINAAIRLKGYDSNIEIINTDKRKEQHTIQLPKDLYAKIVNQSIDHQISKQQVIAEIIRKHYT